MTPPGAEELAFTPGGLTAPRGIKSLKWCYCAPRESGLRVQTNAHSSPDAVRQRQRNGNELSLRKGSTSASPMYVVNLLVGRAGFEPATNGLKVRCSTD